MAAITAGQIDAFGKARQTENDAVAPRIHSCPMPLNDLCDRVVTLNEQLIRAACLDPFCHVEHLASRGEQDQHPPRLLDLCTGLGFQCFG